MNHNLWSYWIIIHIIPLLSYFLQFLKFVVQSKWFNLWFFNYRILNWKLFNLKILILLRQCWLKTIQASWHTHLTLIFQVWKINALMMFSVRSFRALWLIIIQIVHIWNLRFVFRIWRFPWTLVVYLWVKTVVFITYAFSPVQSKIEILCFDYSFYSRLTG